MPNLLQIGLLGNAVLRQKAEPVKKIRDSFIRDLIADMMATCIELGAYGLAAPQVHHSLRIFVVNCPQLTKTVIINPIIYPRPEYNSEMWEGCLSIPGLRGHVLRPEFTLVEYSDLKGKRVRCECGKDLARTVLHEYDHLEGVLFLDRIHPTKLISEYEWRKIHRPV